MPGARSLNRGRGGDGLSGWPGLACAILARAYRDAQSSNGVRADALEWLGSDGAADLLANLGEALGMDLDGDDLAALCEVLESG